MKFYLVRKLLILFVVASNLLLCMQQESSAEKIQIITLPSDRWSEFKELRLKAATESPQDIGVTIADVMNRDDADYKTLLDKALISEGAWMVFAEVEGELVAMAGALCVMNHLSTMQHVVKLISVYTVPQFRKKSIATKLIKKLILQLENSGITQVQVWVIQENDSAIKLYEKLGFSKCGILSNFICVNGIFYNAYIMEHSLSA